MLLAFVLVASLVSLSHGTPVGGDGGFLPVLNQQFNLGKESQSCLLSSFDDLFLLSGSSRSSSGEDYPLITPVRTSQSYPDPRKGVTGMEAFDNRMDTLSFVTLGTTVSEDHSEQKIWMKLEFDKIYHIDSVRTILFL